MRDAVKHTTGDLVMNGSQGLVMAYGLAMFIVIGIGIVTEQHRIAAQHIPHTHVSVLPLCDMDHFDITKDCRFH